MTLTEQLEHIQAIVPPQIHTMSLGCLDSYFHLTEDLQSRKAELCGSRNQILILHCRKKTYLLSSETTSNDQAILQSAQANSVIYTPTDVTYLSKGHGFTEVVYPLKTVFDRNSYPNKKKRYARLVYPIKWMDSHACQVTREPKDKDEVKDLHSQWVEHKMADPKTFRIMFPQARYIRCYERFAAQPPSIRYNGWFFYLQGRLVSVRIVSIYGDWAYDLANFTNIWDTPSQISNYFEYWVLKSLWEEHAVTQFNCGAVLNKHLQQFKLHYPHRLEQSYAYSKITPPQLPPAHQQKSFF